MKTIIKPALGVVAALAFTLVAAPAATIQFQNGLNSYGGASQSNLVQSNGNNYPQNPYDIAGLIYAGMNGSDGWNSLIQFSGLDSSVLAGPGVTITSAKIILTSAYPQTVSLDVFALKPANSGWVQGASRASWNYRDASAGGPEAYWAGGYGSGAGASGTDHDVIAITTLNITPLGNPDLSTLEFAIDAALITSWLIPSDNAGLIFKADNPLVDAYAGFYGTNTGDLSRSPILEVSYTVIPEPSAISLVGAGFAGIGFLLRRRISRG